MSKKEVEEQFKRIGLSDAEGGRKNRAHFEYEGNRAQFIDEFHKWRRRLEKKGIKIINWGI